MLHAVDEPETTASLLGAVIEQGGDIFGDGVNMAILLLSDAPTVIARTDPAGPRRIDIIFDGGHHYRDACPRTESGIRPAGRQAGHPGVRLTPRGVAFVSRGMADDRTCLDTLPVGEQVLAGRIVPLVFTTSNLELTSNLGIANEFTRQPSHHF